MDGTPTNGTKWMLTNHEDRLKNLESQNIAVVNERVSNLSREMDIFKSDIKDDISSIRRLLYGAAVSITVSAIGSSLVLFLVFK